VRRSLLNFVSEEIITSTVDGPYHDGFPQIIPAVHLPFGDGVMAGKGTFDQREIPESAFSYCPLAQIASSRSRRFHGFDPLITVSRHRQTVEASSNAPLRPG
jgi:hypothetical protein